MEWGLTGRKQSSDNANACVHSLSGFRNLFYVKGSVLFELTFSLLSTSPARVLNYALLTPISHPGCIMNPLVCPNAASACAGEANVTEKAFAPGFVPAGGNGVADVYPGYLPISLSFEKGGELGLTVRIVHP